MIGILVFVGGSFLEIEVSLGIEDEDVDRAVAQGFLMNFPTTGHTDDLIILIHHFQVFFFRGFGHVLMRLSSCLSGYFIS